MKKFLSHIFLFIIILAMIKVIMGLFLLFNLNDSNSKKYIGDFSNNKARIVIVGSSNINFNYDFKYLNSYYLDYDVIGCQLSEPSGFFALINKLKKLDMNENDILVFSLPHSLFESEKFLPVKSYKKQGFNKKLISEAFSEFPFYTFKGFFIEPKFNDIVKIVNNKKNKQLDTIRKMQFKSESDAYQDVFYNRCHKSIVDMFFVKSTGLEKEYIDNISKYLNKTFDSKILFRFPALMENNFIIDENRIMYLKNNLQFINSFSSSVYSEAYFFNQWYHLNKCGSEISSKNLVNELISFVE